MGFDIIGLPYYEYMNTDDGLMVFRCGKHGEFAYQLIGSQAVPVYNVDEATRNRIKNIY